PCRLVGERQRIVCVLQQKMMETAVSGNDGQVGLCEIPFARFPLKDIIDAFGFPGQHIGTAAVDRSDDSGKNNAGGFVECHFNIVELDTGLTATADGKQRKEKDHQNSEVQIVERVDHGLNNL